MTTTTTATIGYTLMNGVELNKQHPDTFWMPSHKNRLDAAKEYKTVKLGFQPTEKGGIGERMWVNVLDYDGEIVVGELASIPIMFSHDVLDYGDEVFFTLENIIDIYDDEEEDE